MALWRMNVRVLSTGRVSPYWVLGAPLPGPRVPFCPNAGWLDWVRCVLAVDAALVTGWELVDDAEFDPLYTGDELELPEELDVDVGEGAGGGAALWLFDGRRCAR